jgi:hypothetical protein
MTANANNVTNPPVCLKCEVSAPIGIVSGLISFVSIPAILGLAMGPLNGISLTTVIVMPVLSAICISSIVTSVGTIIYYFKHAEPEEVGPR